MSNATEPVIRRHHHITLCTGGAQEDYDFHTQVLSLKSVKKTALYDGIALALSDPVIDSVVFCKEFELL